MPRAASRLCPGLDFKYLQGWRLHTASLGNVAHCLSSQYKSSLVFTRNLRSFVLCPLASALSEGTTEKSLVPSGFLPIKYLLSCLLAIPGLHWWLGLFHPTGRTWNFLFLNVIELFTKLGAQMFSWISVHLTVHSFKPNFISLSMMMLRGSLKSLA